MLNINKSKFFCLIATLTICLVVAIQLSSALVIKSIDTPEISPGEDGDIIVKIENNLNNAIEEIYFSIDTRSSPFSLRSSSSEVFIDELDEGEDTNFAFKIRASPTATPGDYNIPYALSYKGLSQPRTGIMSVRIKGSPELEITKFADKAVLGSEGKLTFKIVNKGLAEARYVSFKLVPIGISVLSENDVYIGDIRANDFETVSFNVKYESLSPVIVALVEYRDFNNEPKKLTFKDTLNVYTQEEALKLGIIKKNNTTLYIALLLAIIVILFIWRAIKKRIRRKRSLQQASL